MYKEDLTTASYHMQIISWTLNVTHLVMGTFELSKNSKGVVVCYTSIERDIPCALAPVWGFESIMGTAVRGSLVLNMAI